MKSRVKGLSRLTAAMLLIAATPFVASLTVDQEYDGPFAFDLGMNTATGVSQSFTPTASRLDAVDLFFTGIGSNPALVLPVEITTSLNGPVIGATTVAIPTGLNASPANPAVIQVTFTPYVPLTPGAEYFIRIGPDGGFGIGVAASFGDPYPAGAGYQGDFTIFGLDWGFRTYFSDAEPPGVGPPTTKDACKNGGWATFTVPRTFKNQGDCIQYVITGK
jgi:hypothetical protein